MAVFPILRQKPPIRSPHIPAVRKLGHSRQQIFSKGSSLAGASKGGRQYMRFWLNRPKCTSYVPTCQPLFAGFNSIQFKTAKSGRVSTPTAQEASHCGALISLVG
jgi:hypothetical protein